MEGKEFGVSSEAMTIDAAILVIQATGLHLEFHTHQIRTIVIYMVYATSRHPLNNFLTRNTRQLQGYKIVDHAGRVAIPMLDWSCTRPFRFWEAHKSKVGLRWQMSSIPGFLR
ncbi:hypothetical protein C8K58_1105 [Pseudomonas sp. GV047]|nr:hypothetical protein C8K58_1105 [Pseudomonas sp. GV047]